jgi:hypothetical protein
MEMKICIGPLGILPNGSFCVGPLSKLPSGSFEIFVTAGRLVTRMTVLTSADADAGAAAKNAQAMAQAAAARTRAGDPCNADKAIWFARKLLNRSSPSRRETQPKLGILMELTAFRHGLVGLRTSPLGIMANRQQI